MPNRRPGQGTNPLRPLAQDLKSILQVTFDLLEQEVGVGSEAERLLLSRDLLGGGVREPGREMIYLPQQLLNHTTDHLGGLIAAVNADGVVYAAITLLRPILESTATAYWLLEPAIDDRERLRRWMNLRLASLGETLRLVGPEERQSDRALSTGNQVYWILHHGQQLGFTAAKQGNRQGLEPIWHLGRPVPGDGRLIAALLEEPTIGLDAGPIMHRLTSAVVHARLHGLMLMTHKAGAVRQDDGGWLTPVAVDLRTMTQYCAPVIWGLRTCLDRAAVFYGWESAAWHRATLKIMSSWRPHLHPA